MHDNIVTWITISLMPLISIMSSISSCKPNYAVLRSYQFLPKYHFFVAPSVRLVGGNSTHEGRVEIFLHGEWGTVCDDDWTITDANVVCKQLGYSEGASAAHKSAHFGQGTGIIWLDDVQCTGSEEHLYDCTNAGAGIHNCGHEKDAGVTCECNNECTSI